MAALCLLVLPLGIALGVYVVRVARLVPNSNRDFHPADSGE